MYYLLRSGEIIKYQRSGIAPESTYLRNVYFHLKHLRAVSISEIINQYFEQEIDIEITILRKINQALIDAVNHNEKKRPILKNIMDILETDLKNYEEQENKMKLEK